jgi:hypothetical protein
VSAYQQRVPSGSTLLAIDPGTTHSGVVWFHHGGVLDCGVYENDEVLDLMGGGIVGCVAIEMIASYGMAVGREVFETCVWIGRFIESTCNPESVRLIYRRDVKLHLCGSVKAKDANVRQALIDRWGGKAEAIGNIKKPGPLYAVKSHAWAALAVAVTAAETKP